MIVLIIDGAAAAPSGCVPPPNKLQADKDSAKHRPTIILI
jgi:hypothetical protein